MAKIALLIEISEYEPDLNPLPSAVKDVEPKERSPLHNMLIVACPKKTRGCFDNYLFAFA